MTTQAFTADSVKDYIGTPETTPGSVNTMTVLMKTNKYYTDGSLKQTGVSYTVTRDWGKTAVEQGWASDTSAVLPVIPSPAGLTASQVAATQALVSKDGIVLSSATSSAWIPMLGAMRISVVTASGTATVAVYGRDRLAAETLLATVSADTAVVRDLIYSDGITDVRFERTAGTGTVTVEVN